MRITVAIVGAVAATLTASTLVQSALMVRAVLPGFADVELTDALDKLTQLRAVIEPDAEVMSSGVVDWARWDESFELVGSDTTLVVAGYIERNVTIDALRSQGLDGLAALDLRGRVVLAMTARPGSDEVFPGADVDALTLPPGDPQVARALASGPSTAIRVLPSGVWMTAVGPVSRSSGGEINGYMIFARRFDAP